MNKTTQGAFWTTSISETKSAYISIHKDKLLAFISSDLGFNLMANSYDLVRITDRCIVQSAKLDDIKQEIKRYLLEVAKEEDVWSAFLEQKLITNEFIGYINALEPLKFNLSTKEQAVLFFSNGVVKVSDEKGVCLTPYTEFKGYVWKGQVVDREFVLIEDAAKTAEFSAFLWNVSGSAEKQNYLKSIIGYLLHPYKDRANSKAVILIDEKTDFTGRAHGGTGKSIIANAIGRLTPMAWKDGRNFSEKENFAYDDVKSETRVLYFDDAQRTMSLEPFYSLITGDMTVKRKYKDSQTVPFALTPKLLITTNYLIRGAGGDTDERRRLEFEVASHYSKDYTPADEFGHNLFDDWGKSEWTLFDNFMLGCVQHYLTSGITPVVSDDMGIKKLIMATNEEFVEFAEEEISFDARINKTELYLKFIQQAQNKSISTQRFKVWLDDWATYKGFALEHKKSNGKSIAIPVELEMG